LNFKCDRFLGGIIEMAFLKTRADIVAGVACFVVAGLSSISCVYLLMRPEVSEVFGFITPCRSEMSQIIGMFSSYIGTISCLERQQQFDKQIQKIQIVVLVVVGVGTYKEFYERIRNMMEKPAETPVN
jgi:hypothetical protein